MENLKIWQEKTDNSEIGSVTLTDFRKVFDQDAVDAVNSAFTDLKDREESPAGEFDSKGRFFLSAELRKLSTSRAPSRAYPYSEMNEGRTRKFLMKVWIYHNCKTLKDLTDLVFSKDK